MQRGQAEDGGARLGIHLGEQLGFLLPQKLVGDFIGDRLVPRQRTRANKSYLT
jgi:hypothetical protein